MLLHGRYSLLNEYNGFVRALNLKIDRFPIKILRHYYFNAEVVVAIFAYGAYIGK